MKREIFLLISAIVQVLLGIYFFFFSEMAAAQFVQGMTDTSLFLEKSLGVFSIAFGLTTFLCRKCPDSVALRSVLTGTLFYLILTTIVDGAAILKGVYSVQAWGGIIFRIVFVFGYLYYVSKIRIRDKDHVKSAKKYFETLSN